MQPKPGVKVSFYHEGGHGERKWVVGWRAGVIAHIPSKGRQLGQAQIELLVPCWARDLVKRMWVRQPNVKVWVPLTCVNELGDCTYHGPTTLEVYEERQEEKAAQQKKADRKKGRR